MSAAAKTASGSGRGLDPTNPPERASKAKSEAPSGRARDPRQHPRKNCLAPGSRQPPGVAAHWSRRCAAGRGGSGTRRRSRPHIRGHRARNRPAGGPCATPPHRPQRQARGQRRVWLRKARCRGTDSFPRPPLSSTGGALGFSLDQSLQNAMRPHLNSPSLGGRIRLVNPAPRPVAPGASPEFPRFCQFCPKWAGVAPSPRPDENGTPPQ